MDRLYRGIESKITQKSKIGITNFAQDHLGEIVFIQLPKINHTYEKGKPIS